MTTQREVTTRETRTERDDDRPAGGQRLAAYNSVWQLRVDLWWSIADAARRLAIPSLDDGTRAELAAALHRELADVDRWRTTTPSPAGGWSPRCAISPTAPTAR